MSFCNQCGAELPEGVRFCSQCGAAAGTVPSGTAAPTMAPPSPSAPPAGAARPTSFSQPPVSDVSAQAPGSGLGWILPALLVVAAVAIAYLVFAPKRDARPVMDGPVATNGTQRGDDAGRGRAVGDAPDTSTASGPDTRIATDSVSAAVLDSAFNSDPAGAALRYGGPIRVSGTIASMVQPGRTPALSMEGRTRFNFIVVNFPAGYRERLAPLYKGQFISVSCDEARGLAGTTILSGCLLV